MGSLQLSDLRAEVTSHLAERDDVTSARLNRALELAQERIARLHDFEELSKIETKTLTYTGTKSTDRFLAFTDLTDKEPKEIYSIRFLDDARSKKLRRITPRQMDKEIPDPEFDSTGIPAIYVIWREKFEWWRIPDKAYKVDFRFQAWPTTLIGAANTFKSDFNRKDDILIALSVSYLYGSFGEYERANRFYGIFVALLREAVGEDDMKPDSEILPAWESDIGRLRDGVNDPFVRSTV